MLLAFGIKWTGNIIQDIIFIIDANVNNLCKAVLYIFCKSTNVQAWLMFANFAFLANLPICKHL